MAASYENARIVELSLGSLNLHVLPNRKEAQVSRDIPLFIRLLEQSVSDVDPLRAL